MTAWPRKRDYVPSKFDTFDETGDPKEHLAHFEHLAKFQMISLNIKSCLSSSSLARSETKESFPLVLQTESEIF